MARAVRGQILVDSAPSAIITGQIFPAAIQSEAPSGEPNTTTDQATKSTSEKEPCEHQPVTDNNLEEPLLLYDQIVAGEVTVAATLCSEHTFPAAIQSEAPSGEPNTTTDQATKSTSEKEPCEHQPVTDNTVQEPLLLYDQIVAGEVTVAATVCSEHTFPAAIQSESPSGEPNTKTDQATKSSSEKEPCEHQPVTDNNLQEPLLLYDQIVAGEVTVAATVCSEHTFPAAIQSEAPSGEPNTTTDQATKSTSEKEPCEHQPVTDNDLQEPLLLYDQIVAGEVTVAATVCSEHTLPAAIQSEAPSREPNTTTDQATKSTSEKEPCEHQPVTDNDLQEPVLLDDQIVAGEVIVAAIVCPNIHSLLPFNPKLPVETRTTRQSRPQRVSLTRDKEPCEHQPVTDNNLQEPILLYDQIVAGEVTVAATVCSEHSLPAAIQSEATSGDPDNTAEQATESRSYP